MNIVLVGAGRLGTNLGLALYQAGHKILQVFSRDMANARLLADALKSSPINKLNELSRYGDLYLLAVPDKEIQEVASSVRHFIPGEAIVAHSSGYTPDDALSGMPNYGVFYPLQSFTKEQPIGFHDVPLMISGSDADVEQKLLKLARQISQKVYLLDERARKVAHIGAVFVNNFSNHLFALAADLLGRENVPFELLHPIILHSARRITELPPEETQTGPAVRGDLETIEKHIAFLKPYPELQDLYKILTEAIIAAKEKRGD